MWNKRQQVTKLKLSGLSILMIGSLVFYSTISASNTIFIDDLDLEHINQGEIIVRELDSPNKKGKTLMIKFSSKSNGIRNYC